MRSRAAPKGVSSLPVPWKLRPVRGVLELLQLEHLAHHVAADQEGVHLIGLKLAPEVHQLIVGEGARGAADGIGTHGEGSAGLSLPSPLRSTSMASSRCIRLMWAPDLPQGDREQIQLLIADGLVGGHQHPPPLVELHQILLGFHLGLGDGAPSSTQRRPSGRRPAPRRWSGSPCRQTG